MRKLALIALVAVGLLPSLAACKTYDTVDEALQAISNSNNSSAEPGWLYINPAIGFVTKFPAGWGVSVEEGDANNRRIVFHNEKGAEFILRLKYMPDKSAQDFTNEILKELTSCLPECCSYSSATENVIFVKETGLSFDSTVFNARSHTLIDQHTIVIKHKEWGFALIAQATTHIDNRVFSDAEADFKSIFDSFSFDLPAPTPVVCPTCTPR